MDRLTTVLSLSQVLHHLILNPKPSQVLHHLNLDENPLKDSKVKKILEKGRAPIKELIAHLEKEAKGGKTKPWATR